MKEKGPERGRVRIIGCIETIAPTEPKRSILITPDRLAQLPYQLKVPTLVECSVLKAEKLGKLGLMTPKGKRLNETTMKHVNRADERWLGATLNDDEPDRLNSLLGSVLIRLGTT